MTMSLAKIGATSPISHIETHEIDDAKRVVHEAFRIASKGREYKFREAGAKLVVKIHIRPEELIEVTRDDGSKATIYLPDSVRAEDKFNSCVGLVMGMGPDAYSGEDRHGNPRFKEPWCRIGDFVVFSRNAGKRVTICGVACMVLYDDQIDGTIDDPNDIEAGHQDYRA